MKKLKEIWAGLTPRQRFIAFVVSVLIVLWLWNKYKATIKGAAKNIQNSTQTAMLQNQGVKPSYGSETYKQFADNLFKYMDGSGTDEEGIYRVFKYIHNDADFLKLDAAFGIRAATDNLFGLLEAEDLNGWITADLSSSEVKKLNSYLKTKGITKQFKISA